MLEHTTPIDRLIVARFLPRVVSACLLALLAACSAALPERTAPVPLPERFVEAAGLDAIGKDAIGRDAVGSDAVGSDALGSDAGLTLWRRLDDPVLAALVDQALARNLSLAQASARLDAARALRDQASFALFPVIGTSAARNRSRASSDDPFVPPGLGVIDNYQAGFDASWEIDLFGRARAARRAVAAGADAAAADFAAARLSIAAEVAQAYFSLRGEQSRLAVQQRQVSNLTENLRLLELRRDAGRGTELDVARSNALGLAIAANLPLTEAAIARAEQRLAVLTVSSVAQLRSELGAARPIPMLAGSLPLGDPEEWLRRRPDVRAAHARLRAAEAEVGVRYADWFPRLTLTGGFGWTAPSASGLGDSAAERWNFGPSLSWRILDFGQVRQEVRASRARAAEALAAWQQSVLLALEEVEGALANYRGTLRSAAALEQAVVRAGDALAIAKLRFDAGAADTLVVLDAERTLLDLENQFASAAIARATALASVYKALAGDFIAPPERDRADTPSPKANP